MKRNCLLIGIALLGVLFGLQRAEALFLDFEDLTDLTPVTTQYSGLGVEFSQAMVLTAGSPSTSLSSRRSPAPTWFLLMVGPWSSYSPAP